MANYDIGLSGIRAAQRALDVIGNNIANAATEGYHRQKINLTPAFTLQTQTDFYGGGVNAEGTTRVVNTLLEQEILRQKSSLEQLGQESVTLSTIENIFGELITEDGGLSTAMDTFFNSLSQLSLHPSEPIWQEQLVSDATFMTAQFQSAGDFLSNLGSQIRFEVGNTLDTINTLTEQIAELNGKIELLEMVDTEPSSMKDMRDSCVTELAQLTGIQVVSTNYGVVNVSIGGIPLVIGSSSNNLDSGYDADGKLGITMDGTFDYNTTVSGGKLGGLLSLKNTIIPGVCDSLDSLASGIMRQINKYHVNGVGSAGSFSELTGSSLTTQDFSNIANVTDGVLNIRVTDNTTGDITRHAIEIDADGAGTGCENLSELAVAITAIPGLTASVNSSNQLKIIADPDYEFDFLPAVLSEPTVTNFNDASPPTVLVSGIYDGDENDTFTFNVLGDGSVGNGSLQLQVLDSGGGLVTTFDIGSGYAAGDLLDLGNGIKISLSVGNLAQTNGDSFQVAALADSDSSGILSAAGLNTFFVGTSATDMAVSSDISENPERIAAALGADMTDNSNVFRMASVKDKALDSLDSLTCGEFYRRMTADIGRQTADRQMRLENVEAMVLNLQNRQGEISGVDINDEAAQMLIYEQMFQAMAKYLNTVNTTLATVMEII
ncbi:MAG: flagellar hook-associated protein FlgK [Anaerohalosphaeraceae bacterium]|nr:flagellar hook-associated protein FlgK [Anaerohalosphaeraceae bacterium]